ncbi:N-acyl-D-amino-acid deacylase family protein [Propionispora vibrioides]|uniref:N-acyl-D-amino-acid deacylase n=1 Tax=Propionispora vibrioides TaxID=112903 RepID=A0A1H8TVI1_9FIRM|nr:D-aminoacylase [Propionispora vibrioides]SEO95009.1 N-acyl-D-amino-acid deacylase [Propionispora vibrioides]
MRILIKNGRLADGSGRSLFPADVVIEGERLACISPVGREGDFDRVIEAEGLVVAPGFIDTHSHSDLAVLLNPVLEPKLCQGITTEVLGQDGISLAPLPVEYVSPWRKNLAGLDGDSDRIDWTYKTTGGYLQLLEQNGVGLNEAYLVPHGNVRMEAMGLDNRLPTALELERMQDIVRRELEAGAFGLSSGLIYMPCAYAGRQELVSLCQVVAGYDGVFVVHQRSEADTVLESMEEILDIGRQSGVKVHFSHFKICGVKNWRYLEPMLHLLDKAAREGIRVSFDQYPYAAGSTMLGVILPPWAHDGGTDKLLGRLQDREARRRMIRDIEQGLPGWDNFWDFAGPDQIYVTSVKTAANRDLVGKNLVEIAGMRGKNVYDAAFDLLNEEGNAVGMVDFYGKEDQVIRILQRPEQNVCTDGLLGGKPHPRVYGSFPKVLGQYVREEKVLTLEAAVRKMTGKPAEAFGLRERGLLKPGYFADVVIFNPNTVRDRGTYIEPAQYPMGIEYVFVNGGLALDDGRPTGKLSGKVLRK